MKSLLLAAALAATALLSTGAAAAAEPRQLTLEQLTERVAWNVHATYPVATLTSALGKPATGTAQHVTEFSQWTFDFSNSDPSSPIVHITVQADLNGGIGQPIASTEPVLGVEPITLPVGLTLREAYRVLLLNGHPGPYSSVALYEVPEGALAYHFQSAADRCVYDVSVQDSELAVSCG
ncbi:hypothetical protein D5S17_17130 [Pseudonocardiaceae bacterium YIM PH 21723]|nr:hypothetical protein D5S17_17130 [Pseudonocardiaceae bacterium YIM PH 21723]